MTRWSPLAAFILLAPCAVAPIVDPANMGPLLDALAAAYPLTRQRNTYVDAYHHMLELRRLQPAGLIIGHIGWFPLQAFKYYWIARQAAENRRHAGLSPATTCEVGFGTGHSAAIFLSATSTLGDTKLGGKHYVFDCTACGGGRQKPALGWAKARAWKYLYETFGHDRLHEYNGHSRDTIPAFAKQETTTTCDLLVIDGDHSFNGVVLDIDIARRTQLWTNETIVLFDDVDEAGVKLALQQAVNKSKLVIVELYSGDRRVDQVFSSQHASPPSFAFPRTYDKVFVEARFLGRGTVPESDSRLHRTRPELVTK